MNATLHTAALEERRRVARELHDGVAQLVVALGYQVDDVADLIEAGPVRDAIAMLRDEVSHLAEELRRALCDLRDETTADDAIVDGLSGELSDYLDRLGRCSDLRIHRQLDEAGSRPSRDVEEQVLRIAREAIANVHQHARAINLWVRLTRDGGRIHLVVEDDGIGAVAPQPGHFGLQGMRERAEQIGGVLEIGVRRDGGTVVTLWAGGAHTKEGESNGRQSSARR
jgi:signal transduction histidine kinase